MSEEIFRHTIQVLKEQRNVALDSLAGAVTENRILQHRLAISDNKILELEKKLMEDRAKAKELLDKANEKAKILSDGVKDIADKELNIRHALENLKETTINGKVA